MAKKTLQTCKPDFVSSSDALAKKDKAIIYLFRKLPTGINLPTLYPVCRQAGSDEQSSNDTIRGISACKVYPEV